MSLARWDDDADSEPHHGPHGLKRYQSSSQSGSDSDQQRGLNLVRVVGSLVTSIYQNIASDLYLRSWCYFDIQHLNVSKVSESTCNSCNPGLQRPVGMMPLHLLPSQTLGAIAMIIVAQPLLIWPMKDFSRCMLWGRHKRESWVNTQKAECHRRESSMLFGNPPASACASSQSKYFIVFALHSGHYPSQPKTAFSGAFSKSQRDKRRSGISEDKPLPKKNKLEIC